jgi:hypothetical protein
VKPSPRRSRDDGAGLDDGDQGIETRVIRDSRQETPPEAAADQIDRRTPLGYLNYAVSHHAGSREWSERRRGDGQK